jgi:hypothetical protein
LTSKAQLENRVAPANAMDVPVKTRPTVAEVQDVIESRKSPATVPKYEWGTEKNLILSDSPSVHMMALTVAIDGPTM